VALDHPIHPDYVAFHFIRLPPPPMNNPFPIEDWKHEVANDDTVLGYEEWREHKTEEFSL
jgi:hypothetical protein